MDKRELIKKMISYLKKDSMNEGFCKAFWESKGQFYYTGNIEKIMILELPELEKYKPTAEAKYWFPRNEAGKQKRIQILLNILKEIEQ